MVKMRNLVHGPPLHPLHVIFKAQIPVELHPGPNYEVQLELEYIGMGVGDMETVWGGCGAEEVEGFGFTKVIRQEKSILEYPNA